MCGSERGGGRAILTRTRLGWLLFVLGVLLQVRAGGWPRAALGLGCIIAGLVLLVMARRSTRP
jgi:hypothetical protein